MKGRERIGGGRREERREKKSSVEALGGYCCGRCRGLNRVPESETLGGYVGGCMEL